MEVSSEMKYLYCVNVQILFHKSGILLQIQYPVTVKLWKWWSSMFQINCHLSFRILGNRILTCRTVSWMSNLTNLFSYWRLVEVPCWFKTSFLPNILWNSTMQGEIDDFTWGEIITTWSEILMLTSHQSDSLLLDIWSRLFKILPNGHT